MMNSWPDKQNQSLTLDFNQIKHFNIITEEFEAGMGFDRRGQSSQPSHKVPGLLVALF